jgi:hypothetical protein
MVVLHGRCVLLVRRWMLILGLLWRRETVWNAIGLGWWIAMMGVLHRVGLRMRMHTVWRRPRRILSGLGRRSRGALLVGGVVREGAVHGRGRGMFGARMVVGGVVRVVVRRALTWLVRRRRRWMVEGGQALLSLGRACPSIWRLDGRQRGAWVVVMLLLLLLLLLLGRRRMVVWMRLRWRRMRLRWLLGLRVGRMRRTLVYGRGRLVRMGWLRVVRLRSRRVEVRRSPAVHDDGSGRAMRSRLCRTYKREPGKARSRSVTQATRGRQGEQRAAKRRAGLWCQGADGRRVVHA